MMSYDVYNISTTCTVPCHCQYICILYFVIFSTIKVFFLFSYNWLFELLVLVEHNSFIKVSPMPQNCKIIMCVTEYLINFLLPSIGLVCKCPSWAWVFLYLFLFLLSAWFWKIFLILLLLLLLLLVLVLLLLLLLLLMLYYGVGRRKLYYFSA